ncbi:hypothetical protein F2Q69_00004298 [Brassica cretica]|uniref:Di19 zinc-binding domain-containing protein n=1 Tax=Brassica cretica TaxID=69181 RepID=A0A8S9NXF1_BRACR|nr:hypothetical protein F2Q69_00004298 [Brassica cretica]
MYAIGGSANPTINSQGNRFLAPDDSFSKEVTKHEDAPESEWSHWNWRSEGDLMLNGAFFTLSGAGPTKSSSYSRASSLAARPSSNVASSINVSHFFDGEYNPNDFAAQHSLASEVLESHHVKKGSEIIGSTCYRLPRTLSSLLKSEFFYPFCADVFDTVELCCHIDEEHPVKAKNGMLQKTRFCSMGGKLMGSIHIVIFCASLHERTKEGGSMMNYLLLFSFNSILGGTAQHHLPTSTTRIRNIETCTFLIELQLSMPYPNRDIGLSTWEIESSPAKWQEKNVFGKYALLRRVPK